MTSWTEIRPGALPAGVRLIDVREPHELTGPLGHIAGVENHPLSTLVEAARPWARDEAILLISRSGARSARAAGELAELGFTRLHNLAGGMMAWNEAGLPVAAGPGT